MNTIYMNTNVILGIMHRFLTITYIYIIIICKFLVTKVFIRKLQLQYTNTVQRLAILTNFQKD